MDQHENQPQENQQHENNSTTTTNNSSPQQPENNSSVNNHQQEKSPSKPEKVVKSVKQQQEKSPSVQQPQQQQPENKMSPNTATVAHLPHLQIVDRFVDRFPASKTLVNSAVGYANARYTQLKSSYPLVTSTLDKAEKTLQAFVSQTVVPVLNQFEQPIQYADNKAVAGFELVQSKLGSFEKQAGELKDSALNVLDQTKTRIQAVKTTTISKVQTVLTYPSNLVPMVDQILSAGELVLDYLLPEDKSLNNSSTNGTTTSPKSISIPKGPAPDSADARVVVRLIFYRMRAFTDKVQRRVVAYSRERWMPALFSRAN